MSRHHMLPPIIYTPPPKPKKVEPKKRRLSAGLLEEIDETAETNETAASSPAAPAALKLPSAQMPEIENSAAKPQGPARRLSQDTLTALLQAQELSEAE